MTAPVFPSMAATVAMAKWHPVSFLHTLLSLLKRTFPALGNLVFMEREWGGVKEKWPQSGWEGGTSFGLGQDMMLQESLVSWSKPCCGRRKSVSAHQGMAHQAVLLVSYTFVKLWSPVVLQHTWAKPRL